MFTICGVVVSSSIHLKYTWSTQFCVSFFRTYKSNQQEAMAPPSGHSLYIDPSHINTPYHMVSVQYEKNNINTQTASFQSEKATRRYDSTLHAYAAAMEILHLTNTRFAPNVCIVVDSRSEPGSWTTYRRRFKQTGNWPRSPSWLHGASSGVLHLGYGSLIPVRKTFRSGT